MRCPQLPALSAKNGQSPLKCIAENYILFRTNLRINKRTKPRIDEKELFTGIQRLNIGLDDLSDFLEPNPADTPCPNLCDMTLRV